MKFVLLQRVLLITLISVTSAYAQKLPNVQKESIWAPAKIYIDGKAEEWGNQFLAHNHATDLFYTLANNEDNLYLLVGANRSDIITKLVHSGVTLAINDTKKSDKGSIMITYPVYKKGEMPFYLTLDGQIENIRDTAEMRMKTDSFINEKNKQLISHLKYIGVKGALSIDSMIFINNKEKILAFSSLDHHFFYTCELSIPLKILGLSFKQKTPFYYHIILNGVVGNNKEVNIIETSHGERITFTGADGKKYVLPPDRDNGMALAFPTDFWGEYALAKLK